MSREKNVFEKFPKKWPKGPFGKPVRGKRRNHGLPSGVKDITGISSTPSMRSEQ